MRVYISVDMEGIAGIDHPAPTSLEDPGYREAVDLMVGETNAAVAGAVEGGATEVLVNDSHGRMHNLRPADLDPRADVIRGQKPWSMVAGAEPLAPGDGPRHDVALFVGYHARAGHPTGVLAHTMAGVAIETRIGGRPTGEYGFNALVLGAWGIPVGMVAGDDALAAEVAEQLPWTERVVVKRAIGTNAAASMHPDRARAAIRAGAATAVRRAAAGELKPFSVPSPVRIEIDFRRGIEADLAALVPAIARLGDRSVRIEEADPVDAFRLFRVAILLAGIAAS